MIDYIDQRLDTHGLRLTFGAERHAWKSTSRFPESQTFDDGC